MSNSHISIRNCVYTDKDIKDFVYEPETKCPRCKSQVAPNPLFSIAYDKNDGKSYVAIISYCTGCHDVFITRYKMGTVLPKNPVAFYSDGLICSEPIYPSEHDFGKEIYQLSPQFCKIYNQSLSAESHCLNELAGLGYRKALEFLIKDFAIHEFPAAEEDIKKKSLSQCIADHISDNRIKDLAQRSAWIGNDEAHYIRKQQDLDVSDMKDFIMATVYFIGIILITEKAASITPKK